MRTAIYVYQPSTVTIRATNPLDANVEICRYNQWSPAPAVGKRTLEPGIYSVVSISPLEITGGHIGVDTSSRDKDLWPEPRPNVIALEPGASTKSIQEFFATDKDVSPGELGIASEPDDVMTDD